jgi:hypothetical protein
MALTSKLNLRMPEDLRLEAQALADRYGLSLNALCVMAIRSHVDWQTRKRRTTLTPRVAQAIAEDAGIRKPGRPSEARASATSAPVAKVGANQPCPCGSGEKYKRCHGKPAA